MNKIKEVDTFTADLHTLLTKHLLMMEIGRDCRVQIAVTPLLAERLSQCDGAESYMGNLRRLDENVRSSNDPFRINAYALLDAGYIDGQTYEQCIEMAKWNPAMRKFMETLGPGGSDTQEQAFGYALLHLTEFSDQFVKSVPPCQFRQ